MIYLPLCGHHLLLEKMVKEKGMEKVKVKAIMKSFSFLLFSQGLGVFFVCIHNDYLFIYLY